MELAKLQDQSIDSIVTDPPAGIAFMGMQWDKNKGGRDQWIAWLADVMREALRVSKPGAHALVWALPRTSHWTATALENAGFEIRDVITHHYGTGFPKSHNLKGEHEGKGTALKPASEHWILARKPFKQTVAANVQEHGTGALNIDACRIGTSKRVPGGISSKGLEHKRNCVYGKYGVETGDESGHNPNVGRWPANLILSHHPDCGDACVEGCPVALMDLQSGHSKSPTGTITQGGDHFFGSDKKTRGTKFQGHGDQGEASRFFYVAKPSRKERGENNKHPTVKPIQLCRYLCKLITPANGIVLDPFCGSGSIGVAAKLEGFGFIGIEQELDYLDLARSRLER